MAAFRFDVDLAVDEDEAFAADLAQVAQHPSGRSGDGGGEGVDASTVATCALGEEWDFGDTAERSEGVVSGEHGGSFRWV